MAARSYHVGGLEGVPLATDATRDTETQTGVLLYPHTQLEGGRKAMRGGRKHRRKEESEDGRKLRKNKCI